MNDRNDPVDQLPHIDPVDVDALTASWSDSPAKQALFQEITAMPTEAATHGTRQRRGMPRRAVFVAVTILAMSIATLAAATGWFGSQDLGLGCRLPDGAVGIERSVTGDPVADCAAMWERQTGEPAPDLTAFINSQGGLVVAPSDDDVPDDWRVLDGEAVADPAVAELQTSLDDIADGLASKCHLLPEAEAVVTRELGRLGLDDWTIGSERGTADGAETCTNSYLVPRNQHVVLFPLDGFVAPSDHPHAVFAQRLAADLNDACRALDDAEARVRTIGSELGIADQITVRAVSDPIADCTRVDVNVGGSVHVILRGPTR